MISEEIGVLTKQIWHMAGLLFLIIALIWALNQQSTLTVSRFSRFDYAQKSNNKRLLSSTDTTESATEGRTELKLTAKTNTNTVIKHDKNK